MVKGREIGGFGCMEATIARFPRHRLGGAQWAGPGYFDHAAEPTQPERKEGRQQRVGRGYEPGRKVYGQQQ